MSLLAESIQCPSMLCETRGVFAKLLIKHFKNQPLSNDAVFLATWNAIIVWRDVNLENTSSLHILCSLHVKQSSLNKNLSYNIVYRTALQIGENVLGDVARALYRLQEKNRTSFRLIT